MTTHMQELTAAQVDIPNEPFDIKVDKIRRSLSGIFSHTYSAEVYVTDGRQVAYFKGGRDDYDLDGGCLLTEPIPINEITDVQSLIEEVATFAPRVEPTWSQCPSGDPKGIVPLDDKVEEALRRHPGIELKFGNVRMPYGLGSPVNYYTRNQRT